MPIYIYNGAEFSEEDVIAKAEEKGLDLNSYINKFGIKRKEDKVPGKTKTAVKKDAVAAVKSTASKSDPFSSEQQGFDISDPTGSNKTFAKSSVPKSSKVNLLKTPGVNDFASTLIKEDSKIKTGLGSSSIMWQSANKKEVAKKVLEQEEQAKKQLELNKTADYRTKVAKDEISFENPDTILKYDLENESQVETVAALNKKLNRLGIEVSQNEFSDKFNFNYINPKPYRASFDQEETESALGVDFDPKDQKGMNEYISKAKDDSYILKAKQRVNKVNPDYLSKITPPSFSIEEKTKQAKASMVSKFKDLEQSNRSYLSSVGMGGGGFNEAGITKQDFENPEDYKLYSTWKKTGILPELEPSKIEAWDKSRKDDFINKASAAYSRTLPSSARKDLEIVTQEAVNDNKHAIKSFDQSVNRYNLRTKDFENNLNAYKSGIIKTPEQGKLLQEEFISLQGEQNFLNERQKQLEIETDTANKIMLPAIKSFGANYNRFSQLATATKATIANVGVALKDLSAYGSAVITDSTHDEVMKRDTSGFVYLASEMDKKQKEYQKSVGITEISSLGDAGNWLMSGIVNNVPSIGMAFTGAAAMPLFFASGYGGKSTQLAIEASDAKERLSANYFALKNTDNPFEQSSLEKQIADDEELLSLPEYKKFASKALYGGSEVAFEILGTLKILKGLGNATKMLPKKTLQEGLQWAIKTGAKNFKTEGLSELGTTLSNNFIDYAILGEDKNFFDVGKESLESFAQGGIMGVGFGGVDTAKVLKRAIVSELASKEQSKRIQDIANQISELTGVSGYALNQGIPLSEQSIPVQKLITELTDESNALENNVVNRIGVDLTVDQAINIGDINRQIRAINKDFAEAANDGSLEPAQLKALETHYRGKFNELVDQRETLLTDPNIIAENKKANTDVRFEFDATAGYNMYNARMQQTSINQVIADFNNLDGVQSQELFDTAKKELELDPKIKNITEKNIKYKALENYSENHYAELIKKGIENAEAFAISNGVNVTIESYDGILEGQTASERIIADFNKSKEAKVPGAKEDFAKGIENGKIDATNVTINGENIALIHIKNAALNGRTGVGSHEVLHSAVKKAFADQKGVDKAGKDLLTYLESYDPNLYALVTERIDSSYAKREERELLTNKGLEKVELRLRDEKGEIIKNENYYEEALNALSDLGADGVELPADSLNAVRNFVNNILPKGLPKFKENEGANVYQFVKDYNKEAHFGKKQASNLINFSGRAIGGDQEKVSSAKLSITKVAEVQKKIDKLEDQYDNDEIEYDVYENNLKIFNEELKKAKLAPEEVIKPKIEKPKVKLTEEDEVKEIIKNEKGSIASDKVQKIYEAKGLNGAQEIIDLFKPITNRIVDKRRDAPGFEKKLLTDEVETGDGGILDLIRTYNPNKGIPLAAYINKQLPLRAIASSKRVLDKQFNKDAEEEKGLMATETADEGFAETEKEKPKYKNALESKVLEPEVLKTAYNKVLTNVRTLKSRIDAPVSLNRTITPLIAEIRDAMGKQLDIDIKTAMGGKKDNQLRSFALKNKKYFLENMTTTFLMGADGKGGVPQAIQKQIDGKWVNYPDWVSKKIDREKTTTDNAGRTSGAELVRRLPNAVNNVSDAAYLGQLLEPDGNPIRGRKESWAKAIAEEIAFDIINTDLIKGGEISDAIKANQERLGAKVLENFTQDFAKQVDRGNVKLSTTIINGINISTNKLGEDIFNAPDLESEIKVINNWIASDGRSIRTLAYIIFGKEDERATNLGLFKQIIAPAIKANSKFEGLLTKDNYNVKQGARGYSIYLGKDKIPLWKDTESIKKNWEKSVDAINSEAVDATNRLIDIIDSFKKDKRTEDDLRAYFSVLKFDQRGLARKVSKAGLGVLGLTASQKPYLEHNAPNYNIMEKAVDYFNKKITEKQLRKFIENSKVNLVPAGLNNFLPAYKEGENRMHAPKVVLYLQDLIDKGYTITNLESEYGSKRKFNALVNLAKSNVNSEANINEDNKVNVVTKSLQLSKTEKGISVFDFDDTVGLTEGSVLYTKTDGTRGKLNAEEFAKKGSLFLEEGAVFDFSEFSKVVGGRPGPMVEKMKKMIGKFGPDNFFILTARPANAAGPIHEFLSSIGIDIPLENITGLGNSAAQAKADWMIGKAAEGYNDFYFSDDAIQNVTAVKNALEVLDVKSKIQQARLKFSKTISADFNKIIEQNTGMEDFKVFSDIVARRRGTGKNRFDFYVPASAADFELLLYRFIGKGALGEKQKEFFDDALLKPYANGNDLMDAARQSIKRDYKALTDTFPGIKKTIESLTPDKDFTYDQAIRVAMWNEEGVEIPGISQRDSKKLTDLVNADPELKAFKEGLIVTGRQGKGWVKPEDFWDTNTIISDLHNLTEGEGRKKFLAEFIENAELMFGKWEQGRLVGPNINKVEAVYGTNVREAIEDVLWRMTTGKNRGYGKDKETSRWANWVNGSTGTIMFLNTRSAALQLLGSVNFLNLRDNNPFAAAKAFANQKQYWADFAYIWNSNKIKERRGGLKEDVAAAEVANAAANSKNKANAVISYLLKVGYTPTQMADSFAIASGGAPYYRNRIKTYIKEGFSEQEAQDKAWSDFTKVADETQQSGDPRDISKQQASGAGRLLLTFQNTAMQQSRIVKKSFLDLKNGRGDAKTNVAKIIYYLGVQNVMFAALQQGLIAVGFGFLDDEEDEAKKKALEKEKDKKVFDIANGVIDTILSGVGFTGKIAVTLKNMAKVYLDERDKNFKADYAKVVIEGANLSPPIGSKLRKLYSGLQQTKYDKDLIKERGWEVMQDGRVHLGPMYSVTGKVVESFTNVPLDRLNTKIENVSQAMNSQNEAWQRVMIGLGFNPYSLGVKGTKGDEQIEAKAKEVRKVEGQIKAKETRERTRDSIKELPMWRQMELKREAKAKRRNRRRMG